MSVFGSRKDDPLLQNDPLAPGSDEDSGEDDPDQHASSTEEDSVFRRTTSDGDGAENSHFRFDGSEDTRVLVRSATEVVDGRLTVLNAAFDEGWRLERIEIEENAPEDEPSSTDTALTLGFVLQRPTPE